MWMEPEAWGEGVQSRMVIQANRFVLFRSHFQGFRNMLFIFVCFFFITMGILVGSG